MLIRLATPNDYDAIRAVEVDAYQALAETLGPQDRQQMLHLLRDVETPAKLGEWIVADDGRAIVGAVALFPPHDPPTHPLFPPAWAYIRSLGVSPTYQAQGIGRQLTEFCIARARQQGAPCLGLHTSEAMPVARRLYERMGFVIEQAMAPVHGLRAWRYVIQLTDERKP